MKMKTDHKQVFETEINGKPLRVEIGELAKQANGSCMVYYGETAVLVAATASNKPKDLPFFPLQVNYEERLYSVGKIPGGFIKREGDRKSTRLNSSHVATSYAVFCLKKK